MKAIQDYIAEEAAAIQANADGGCPVAARAMRIHRGEKRKADACPDPNCDRKDDESTYYFVCRFVEKLDAEAKDGNMKSAKALADLYSKGAYWIEADANKAEQYAKIAGDCDCVYDWEHFIGLEKHIEYVNENEMRLAKQRWERDNAES